MMISFVGRSPGTGVTCQGFIEAIEEGLEVRVCLGCLFQGLLSTDTSVHEGLIKKGCQCVMWPLPGGHEVLLVRGDLLSGRFRDLREPEDCPADMSTDPRHVKFKRKP